ncbi:hypothetical protein HPB48_016370 [Haemaphysalis longicornis]|uniref:Uncharacterized protein n=1 Tax=Haemaphysalis longicornis TaxID=44386 RepID=A0A9J6GGN5_HAELO|nr:hypothetical protein HPB48_016370 [Haemaphysalis longicornis]
MDRAKFPCILFEQFFGFWCLQLMDRPLLFVHCPATADLPVPRDCLELLGRPLDRLTCVYSRFRNDCASWSAQPLQQPRPYIQPFSLSWNCPSSGTATAQTPVLNRLKRPDRSSAAFSGLGSATKMGRANVPRIFFVQVKNTHCLFIKRSSNRCLLVLPSPGCICVNVYDCACILRDLLILAGDIETNPGPPDNVPTDAPTEMINMLKELQSGQTAMLEQLISIKMTLADHDKTFTEIKVQLDKIETAYSSIETMKSEIIEIQTATNASTNELKILTGRINDAENESRRNNLVFYGVKDQRMKPGWRVKMQ